MKLKLAGVFFLVIMVMGILGSCKHKKKAVLSGDDPVEVADFIDFFQPVSLPYSFNDSTLIRKDKDSSLISYKVFTQFVPDSFLTGIFGKNSKPKLYPLGAVKGEGGARYLFVKGTAANNKKAAFILAFDKKNQFIAGLAPLSSPIPSIQQNVTVDRHYTITKTSSKKKNDGTVSEGKDVYVLNGDAHTFQYFSAHHD
jgi:hypothetical protein